MNYYLYGYPEKSGKKIYASAATIDPSLQSKKSLEQFTTAFLLYIRDGRKIVREYEDLKSSMGKFEEDLSEVTRKHGTRNGHHHTGHRKPDDLSECNDRKEAPECDRELRGDDDDGNNDQRLGTLVDSRISGDKPCYNYFLRKPCRDTPCPYSHSEKAMAEVLDQKLRELSVGRLNGVKFTDLPELCDKAKKKEEARLDKPHAPDRR